jgi:hypothetical protein
MYTKINSGENVEVIVSEFSEAGKIIASSRHSDVMADDLHFHVFEVGDRGEVGQLSMKMARYFRKFERWGISRLNKPYRVFVDLESRKNEFEMVPHLRCIDYIVCQTRRNLKLDLQTLDLHIMRTDGGNIKNEAVKYIEFSGRIEPLRSKNYADIFDGLSKYADIHIKDRVRVEGFSIKENLISIDVGS